MVFCDLCPCDPVVWEAEAEGTRAQGHPTPTASSRPAWVKGGLSQKPHSDPVGTQETGQPGLHSKTVLNQNKGTNKKQAPKPLPHPFLDRQQISHDSTCRNSRSRPRTQVTPIWTVWVNRNGVNSAGDYPKVQSVAGPQELWNTLTKKAESLDLQPEISQGGHEPTPTGLEMLTKYVCLDQLVITIFSC